MADVAQGRTARQAEYRKSGHDEEIVLDHEAPLAGLSLDGTILFSLRLSTLSRQQQIWMSRKDEAIKTQARPQETRNTISSTTDEDVRTRDRRGPGQPRDPADTAHTRVTKILREISRSEKGKR